MRIRRHAKLNGLSLTATAPGGCSPDLTPRSTSSSRLQHNSPHICQLNQSPWDLLSFPPDSPSSPFQVMDGDESNYTANGSSGNSLAAVESGNTRGYSVASMRMSLNVEKNVNRDTNGIELGFGNGGAISYCKTVGKSWQCKKEASKGHSLSQHHLPLPSAASAKKSEKPPVVDVAGATNPIRRRGRPRKVQIQPPPPPPPPPTTANPYEFYYYSGFGPRWGKKRGVRDVPKSDSVEEEEEEEIVREIVPQHSSLLSSSSSEIDSEEFDYIEDDDDENKEDKRNVKKRRGRKPIKARSLKSLM